MTLSVNSYQDIECKLLHVGHQKPCIRVEPNDSFNCIKKIKSCFKTYKTNDSSFVLNMSTIMDADHGADASDMNVAENSRDRKSVV